MYEYAGRIKCKNIVFVNIDRSIIIEKKKTRKNPRSLRGRKKNPSVTYTVYTLLTLSRVTHNIIAFNKTSKLVDTTKTHQLGNTRIKGSYL